jgi:hypothetical protein
MFIVMRSVTDVLIGALYLHCQVRAKLVEPSTVDEVGYEFRTNYEFDLISSLIMNNTGHVLSGLVFPPLVILRGALFYDHARK